MLPQTLEVLESMVAMNGTRLPRGEMTLHPVKENDELTVSGKHNYLFSLPQCIPRVRVAVYWTTGGVRGHLVPVLALVVGR